MSVWNAKGPDDVSRSFRGKSAMFDDMRERFGNGAKFDCCDGKAFYVYEITQFGYSRVEGETPVERQRNGRKQ